MARLELISHRPRRPNGLPPVLFVHGAFSGAWIWEAKFLPWFAERGFSAHAVSLRGHGASEGRENLPWYGVQDYVDDVAEAIARIDGLPVLVGHSMGGMIVQRALLAHRVPAAALLASAPPHGLMTSTWGLAWRNPWVFQQMTVLQTLGARAVNPEAIRRAMFSDRMPRDEMVRYEPLLQEESKRVLVEMMGLQPPVRPPGMPVAVMGAGGDLLFPEAEVRATALAYGVDPIFFPGMAHAMMLEPGWDQVAEALAAWMERTLSPAEAGAEVSGTSPAGPPRRATGAPTGSARRPRSPRRPAASRPG